MTCSVSPHTTSAYHPGPKGVRTAFVLAVPGRKEGVAGRPAAGSTGDNLDRILAHLNRHDSTAFHSTDRYDYRIANAWETIMFGRKSMPTLADVREPRNLARLAEQLRGVATIVALSAPAMHGVLGANLHLTYRHSVHPGMLGLNNRYRGLDRDPKRRQWRVEERCRLYAAEVIASIAAGQDAPPAAPSGLNLAALATRQTEPPPLSRTIARHGPG